MIIIFIFYNFSLKFPISLDSNSCTKIFRIEIDVCTASSNRKSHTIDEKCLKRSENDIMFGVDGLRCVCVYMTALRHTNATAIATLRFPAKISFLFFFVINESNQIDIYPTLALYSHRFSIYAACPSSREVGWWLFDHISSYHVFSFFGDCVCSAFFCVCAAAARMVSVAVHICDCRYATFFFFSSKQWHLVTWNAISIKMMSKTTMLGQQRNDNDEIGSESTENHRVLQINWSHRKWFHRDRPGTTVQPQKKV